MDKKRILHYLFNSIIVSLLIAAFIAFLPHPDDSYGLSQSDKLMMTLMLTFVIYSFVLIIGGVVSTLAYLISNSIWISLLFFILTGLIVYFIHPMLLDHKNSYIYIVASLVFWAIDAWFYRIWLKKISLKQNSSS